MPSKQRGKREGSRGEGLLDLLIDKETTRPDPIGADGFACHTAVLAQSGSGKSFLLGRLVEELLLKTKARVVVLDPNSDFVRLPQVDATAWTRAGLRPWFSPTDTAAAFRSQWAQVNPMVLTNRNLGVSSDVQPLRIDWGGLSDVERANVVGLESMTQPELYAAFTFASDLAEERWTEERGEADREAYDFEYFRQVADELCEYLLSATGDAESDIADKPLAKSLRTSGSTLGLKLRALIASVRPFDIWRSSGDDSADIGETITNGGRATVIDLLSVDREAERLALMTKVLGTLWANARDSYSAALRDSSEPDTRVPTFIVIDEAHNVVPATRFSPSAERLATEIIRIAAEGRKFGLFLVVATQRPRKLDANILSECDALLLMKMTNLSDLANAAELFGLDLALLRKAQRLKLGDVLLFGRPASDVTTGRVSHSAPRRTMQGGRGLDKDTWTTIA